MDEGFKILEKAFFATMKLMFRGGKAALRYAHDLQKANSLTQDYLPDGLYTKPALPIEKWRNYVVSLPRTTEWDATRAYQLMSQLLMNYPALMFRINGSKSVITWQIIDSWLEIPQQNILSTIRAIYPEAEITAHKMAFGDESAFYRSVITTGMRAIFPAPLVRVDDLNQLDPLTTITQAMSELEGNESIKITLVVAGVALNAQQAASQMLTVSNINIADWVGLDTGLAALGRKISGADREALYEQALIDVFTEKLSRPLYHAFLSIQIDAATPERVDALISPMTNVFEFAADRLNGLVPTSEVSYQHVDSAERNMQTNAFAVLSSLLAAKSPQLHNMTLILEPWELAALWHLPHKGFTAPKINWQAGKLVNIPSELTQVQEGVILGDNRYAGRETVVRLPYATRETHAAIFGATGVGKSNLMHNMIAQDIANGKGVCVIDPLGNLVRDILRYSIPPERENDVVILDIANEENPPPLNLMSIPKSNALEPSANPMIAIMQKVYPEMEGKRWADTFSMAAWTLWGQQQATIRDVLRVLKEKAYREALLEQTDNEVIHEFWEEFEAMTGNQQKDYIRPITHRVRGFYGNPYFYPVTCHPQPINFPQLMRDQKIVLVSLNMDEAKLPGRDRQLLGALAVSQVQMAALSKACMEHGYYLYVDEVQKFVTTSLPTIFSQARQFNLSLTTSNQYLKQLFGDTADAVRGTVGTFVFFQLGDDDAPIAARHTQPEFARDDFLHMGKFKAAIRTGLGDQTLPAFSLQTRRAYPEELKDSEAAVQREQELRALSVKNYTPMTKAEVKKWLNERYPRGKGKKATDDDIYEQI